MNSVIKGASYVLAFAPDLVLHNGTTQTTEKTVNPGSEYLKELPGHLRTYEDVLAYLPNQTYIGNITPEELALTPQPWHTLQAAQPRRFGPFGEIMPEGEFYLLLAVCDAFDLVKLDADFVARTREDFCHMPAVSPEMAARLGAGFPAAEIAALVEQEGAEGLYEQGRLVGCVKRAHDVDQNLSSHVILENLVSKAGSVLALRHLIINSGLDPAAVDYVIDCGEEACGDMNQRGGGNFAKAAAEIAGLVNAGGSDTRGFCAGPAHALVEAAALVKAGAYRSVAVTAGGSTAKLGMNAKDHVKKGLPVLEDVLAGFAVLISENDGVSPEINLDILGRHTVGTGSSPQAVITSLIAAPLERAGLKITDIDKYSPELQNPDITKPAGAGDVPLANYKMIGALAVKKGELERQELEEFTRRHGLTGWAPTQGHVPSGVPYIGFACRDLLAGRIRRAMIVGKGSLFLGRMTNLFDGVSFVLQPNRGPAGQAAGRAGGTAGAGEGAGDTGAAAEAAWAAVTREELKAIVARAMRDFAATLLAADGGNDGDGGHE